MQEIHSITLWGDSVMRGVVYDEQRGPLGLLPENAAERASKTLGLTLHNRSRMGCTVTKGLSIMKRDMEAGMDSQAALLEFGGNDCDYDWAAVARDPEGDHQPKTPLGAVHGTASGDGCRRAPEGDAAYYNHASPHSCPPVL